MSRGNLTKLIPSSQCIGDSLRTFNTNFSALDTGLFNVPSVMSNDPNITTSTSSDRYYKPQLQIFTDPTPTAFQTTFTYNTPNVVETVLSLEDGTERKAYTFPYSPTWSTKRPLGTFETITNNSGYPQITLFWMSSANTEGTVFATNSATNNADLGFNEPITALYKDNNKLYIGGSFTTANGTNTNKFAIIDVQKGNQDSTYGFVGSMLFNPLSSATKNLGTIGEVLCIEKQTVNNFSLLIIGGSFESETLGRGLVIYNETLDLFYSFYVNGSVRSLLINETELLIGGDFDYLNYGAESALSTSTARVYCNGLAKISLSDILTAPLFAINSEFCNKILQTFPLPVQINSIVKHENNLYVGGNFQILNQSNQITHKNLALFNLSTGELATNWLYNLDKPVYTLCADAVAAILYVGGDFTTIRTFNDNYVLNRTVTEEDRYGRAAAFSLSIPEIPSLISMWKPMFNKTVSKIIISNERLQSEIYAMGQFTEANGYSVGHIAAISKATEFVSFGSKGIYIPWNMHLSTAPPLFTNALVTTPRSDQQNTNLFVGGNFNQVNGKQRKYLAAVAGIGQNIYNPPPSTIAFDVGGTLISQYQNISLDFNNGVRQISETSPLGVVNKTTFSPLKEGFKGIAKNQLCRFYVRRPGNSPAIGNFGATSDTYQQDVYVLGWTVTFVPH